MLSYSHISITPYENSNFTYHMLTKITDNDAETRQRRLYNQGTSTDRFGTGQSYTLDAILDVV